MDIERLAYQSQSYLNPSSVDLIVNLLVELIAYFDRYQKSFIAINRFTIIAFSQPQLALLVLHKFLRLLNYKRTINFKIFSPTGN